MVEQRQAREQSAAQQGEPASGPRLAGVQFVAGTSRRTVILFVASVFMFWMGLYLYMPTLPTYVRSKADDLAMVGVVLSMYGLWQAIIRIPVGVAADIIGRRKPFILGGMFLVGLGAFVVVRATGINSMIAGRAIVGLSAGTWVPLVVFFSALFPPAEAVRATTLLNLVGSTSRVLATGLNGTLNKVGGFELAYYLATAAAFIAILLMLPCKEERRPRVPPSFKSVFRLFGRKDVFLPTFLATVCQYAVWATTFGFVPILARDLGASDVTLSMLTSVSLAVLTLGTFFASTLVNRIGTQRMLYASFIILSLGVAGAGLAPSIGALFAVQMLLGLGQGLGTPVMMGVEHPPRGRSRAQHGHGLSSVSLCHRHVRRPGGQRGAGGRHGRAGNVRRDGGDMPGPGRDGSLLAGAFGAPTQPDCRGRLSKKSRQIKNRARSLTSAPCSHLP